MIPGSEAIIITKFEAKQMIALIFGIPYSHFRAVPDGWEYNDRWAHLKASRELINSLLEAAREPEEHDG